jgi:hypothetical protein
VERGQTDIAGARRAAALVLDVVKELGQQGSIEILDPQSAGGASKSICREAKEEPESVAVASNGVTAGAELSD